MSDAHTGHAGPTNPYTRERSAAGGRAEATYVDKRQFLAGAVCRTQGWYCCHEPEAPVSPGLRWRFYAGAEVGRRARTWLGDGRLLPRTPRDDALRITQDAIGSAESRLLFEASFAWNGLIARADAIRRSANGWTVIEVKQAKLPRDGKPDGNHVDDLAYTALVAMKCGLPVDRAVLALLNPEYTLDGDAELMVELDITERALARAEELERIAREVEVVITANTRPEPALKYACRKCDYYRTQCVGKGVTDPLFLIPYLRQKRFEELRPYERISRLPPDVQLTEGQMRVVDAIRSGEPCADVHALRALDSVVWPAYYLDFEAVTPPLPWFGGRPPHDVTPFQYSLHICSTPDSDPEHREFLAPLADDWRRVLTERLLEDLGSTGSIMVYSSYEKKCLERFADLFPDLRTDLERIVGRLFDLHEIFKKGYCHPGFAGSTSIKKVLPVLVPDLTYEVLEVNNGEDAAGVFALMRVGEYAIETCDAHCQRLREYCKMDTLAMLRLHEAINEIRVAHGR